MKRKYIARFILWSPLVTIAILGIVNVPKVTLLFAGVIALFLAMAWAVDNCE